MPIDDKTGLEYKPDIEKLKVEDDKKDTEYNRNAILNQWSKT